MLIGAARRAVSAQLDLAEDMAALRFSQSLNVGQRTGTSSQNWGSVVADQQEIVRIFVDMQAEIGKSLQESMGQYMTFAPDAMESTIHRGMRQSEDARTNPVSGMISVWESAFKAAADLVRTNTVLARSTAEATAKMQEASDAGSRVASDVQDSSVDDRGTRRPAVADGPHAPSGEHKKKK